MKDHILTAEEKLDAIQSIENFEKDFPESFYVFPMKTDEVDGRYVEPKKKKVYDIKRLWNRHKEILNLDSLGYKEAEIAKILNIHPRTVSITLNSTLGAAAREGIREVRDLEYDSMRDKIMDLTWEALEVYEEIFTDKNESRKMRKDCADTMLLELSGLRAPTKIQSQSVTTVLSAEELDEFKKRGFEASKNAGKLIEIEGE